MQVAWLTDVHLNFLTPEDVELFLKQVADVQADAILLSGDISEALDVDRYLDQMARMIDRPIYFVLGNHDFYYGSIRGTRAVVDLVCKGRPNLTYLTTCESAVELAPGIGLIGHDGWADARYGDYERSLVMMNDYQLIEELAAYNKQDRLPLLRALGDEAAGHIRQLLPAALQRFEHVFMITHIPPLHEACWHQGGLSDNEWVPHFASKAMGDALLEIMPGYPNRRLTVLCGHTHSSGVCTPLPNLKIFTGEARYGEPQVQRLFDLAFVSQEG